MPVICPLMIVCTVIIALPKISTCFTSSCGVIGLLLKFGSLVVMDQHIILLYSIFYNEIYLLTKHKKVKVNIIQAFYSTLMKK